VPTPQTPPPAPDPGPAAALLTGAALAWSLFAFGAVYPWAAPPLLLLALAAAWQARAWPDPRRLTDAALIAVIAAIALQLVPMPPSLQDAVAPAAREFRAAMELGAPAQAWRTLSLDPAATRVGLALALAAFALFLAARACAAVRGRALARWIAWMALVAALLGIGRKMLFPGGLVYGFWTPIESGAAAFGPIINRNHYAAWAVAAIALSAGGLVAHAIRRSEQAPARRRLVIALSDARGLWLLFAIAVSTASVIVTASRAGFIGWLAAAMTMLFAGWRRAGGRAMAVFAAIALVCLAAAMMWSRPDRLLLRIGGSEAGVGLRSEIWRESAGLAARYPIAGTGTGAFPAAMTHYQTRRDLFLNHAHNQYLEIAAEGGLLLSLPLLLAIAGVAGHAWRGLAADRGSFFWLRTGATAALVGLAVLSIWESPFRTPATLMLAAAAAGIAAAPPRR